MASLLLFLLLLLLLLFLLFFSVIVAFRDSAFGPSDTDARAKTLDTFLTVLYDRRHDVSGYVRSACVKVWLNLCKERAIPLDWLPKVAELAASRIRDKSSLVRRSSLLLLSELVVRNPFWKTLDPEYFEGETMFVGVCLLACACWRVLVVVGLCKY